MSLDGAHHDNEPTAYDESAFGDYVGTPWLSGIITFATVIGTFIGAWALIALLGQRRDGFGAEAPLIIIVVVDLVINLALRVIRARKRRALGLNEPPRGNR